MAVKKAKGGKKAASKASKSSSTKKTNSKPIQLKKHKKNPMKMEIVALLVIAVSALLMLSIYLEDGAGVIGVYVRSFVVGMFGFGAYLLPIIIIALSMYALRIKDFNFSLSKITGGLILFSNLVTFVHMLNFDSTVKFNSFADYLSAYLRSASVYNGGLWGAVFGNFFLKTLGPIGSYLVIMIIFVVCAVMLTNKSFFDFVSSAFISLKERIQDMGGDDYADDEYDDYDENEDDNEAEELRILAEKAERQRGAKLRAEQEKEERMRAERAKEAKLSERSRRQIYEEPILPLTVHDRNRAPTVEIEYREKPQPEKKLMLFNESDEPPKKSVLMPPTRKKITEVITIDPTKRIPMTPQEQTMGADGNIEPHLDSANDFNANGYVGGAEDDIFNSRDIGYEEVYIETSASREFPKNIETPRIKTAEQNRNIPISEMINEGRKQEGYDYVFPPISLLNKTPTNLNSMSKMQVLETSRKLEETLKSFGVEAKVIEVSKGPTVTRYELSPGQGVKVSKISNLADDLALNLMANGIRIEAPIPGKAAVGIEVPNKEVTPVFLREVIEDDVFKNYPSKLAFALGKDITGNTIVTDIAKMPHLLIAGATGSGKSVCINTLITSLIYKSSPDDVKLLMVDPKVVELSIYNGIPHLLVPVVTDPKKAASALNWAVSEMINRYNLFAETSVRDLKGYNAYLREFGDGKVLPQIVIIIDELADLMMAAPGEVEDAICRLAQMARAAGLHLIIATQRPSVDVITGVIKANVPSRLAFTVSSGTDSRTILDMVGAEKLLGKGDMLFCPVGMSKPLRVQGAFISDREVEGVVRFLKQGGSHSYDQETIDRINAGKNMGEIDDELDEFFEEALEFVVQKGKASASMLQRQFKIGYNRASRLIEEFEARGIVGPEYGSKPRKVLMTASELTEYRRQAKE